MRREVGRVKDNSWSPLRVLSFGCLNFTMTRKGQVSQGSVQPWSTNRQIFDRTKLVGNGSLKDWNKTLSIQEAGRFAAATMQKQGKCFLHTLKTRSTSDYRH